MGAVAGAIGALSVAVALYLLVMLLRGGDGR